jgi:hypothetical protein
MEDKDAEKDRQKKDKPEDESKGQYGGLDDLGPGGGKGFDKVERPARPDDDRLPDPKD